MKYRPLGTNGPQVSAIGFGAMEMGGAMYGATDDGEVAAAVHRAIDLGITLFDTAPLYGEGRGERLLARALGERRKDVFLVSKTSVSWDPVTLTRKFDSRYSTVKRLTEESLERLETDHLDLLLVHWPDPETPLAETARALEDLVTEGKARFVGVSNYTAHELREIARHAPAHAPVCANQVGYSLFDRRWEREVFPTALELGVGIMTYGPLAHGLLSGTLSPETRFDAADWRGRPDIMGQRLFGREEFPRNLAVVERLKEIAGILGCALPQLALAWVLRHPAVSVALAGCRTPAEVEANVHAPDIDMPPEIAAALDGTMAGAAGLSDTVPGRHHAPA